MTAVRALALHTGFAPNMYPPATRQLVSPKRSQGVPEGVWLWCHLDVFFPYVPHEPNYLSSKCCFPVLNHKEKVWCRLLAKNGVKEKGTQEGHHHLLEPHLRSDTYHFSIFCSEGSHQAQPTVRNRT